jgi:2-(3-amino-3-carboxypropyl)histidine synthase
MFNRANFYFAKFLFYHIHRYDPYEKKITRETYDHKVMLDVRSKSVTDASNAGMFGLVLGTLGRQGSPAVLKTIQVSTRKIA